MLSYSVIIEKLKDILSQELGNKKIFDKDIAVALEIDRQFTLKVQRLEIADSKAD